jgi:poly(A) polymerase
MDHRVASSSPTRPLPADLEGALLGPSPDVETARRLFADDPRHILAVGDLAGRRGVLPPRAISDAARRVVRELGAMPGSERRAAFDAILLGRAPDVGLEFVQRAGGMAVLLPELEATVDFSQEAVGKHKDVWRHTLQVVKQSLPRLEVRWGALLHDIGKVPTRVILPSGEVHFHRHAEVGAAMFDRMWRRFDFQGDFAKKVRFLILHHLRANQYESSWTDSAVRRFAREMGDHLDDLLALSRADITTKRAERRRRGHEQIHELGERIRALAAEDAKVAPLPKGLGNAIMERFGLAPSRLIGDLRDECERAVERGELEAGRDAEHYLEYLARQRPGALGDPAKP